jgi:hypothetical protein
MEWQAIKLFQKYETNASDNLYMKEENLRGTHAILRATRMTVILNELRWFCNRFISPISATVSVIRRLIT